MDIKISGITFEIMAEALEKANAARRSILDVMEAAIPRPRAEISQYAPRILTVMVPVEKIGMIIGPGGKTIRAITEDTGAKIDIDDTGLVLISSVESSAAEKAREIVKSMVEEPEPGKVYKATVKKIMDFGAFAEFLPGKEGLIHISQLDKNRVGKVTDIVNVGDVVDVVLQKIDREGRYNLSRKEYLFKHEKDGQSGDEG